MQAARAIGKKLLGMQASFLAAGISEGNTTAAFQENVNYGSNNRWTFLQYLIWNLIIGTRSGAVPGLLELGSNFTYWNVSSNEWVYWQLMWLHPAWCLIGLLMLAGVCFCEKEVASAWRKMEVSQYGYHCSTTEKFPDVICTLPSVFLHSRLQIMWLFLSPYSVVLSNQAMVSTS